MKRDFTETVSALLRAFDWINEAADDPISVHYGVTPPTDTRRIRGILADSGWTGPELEAEAVDRTSERYVYFSGLGHAIALAEGEE